MAGNIKQLTAVVEEMQRKLLIQQHELEALREESRGFQSIVGHDPKEAAALIEELRTERELAWRERKRLTLLRIAVGNERRRYETAVEESPHENQGALSLDQHLRALARRKGVKHLVGELRISRSSFYRLCGGGGSHRLRTFAEKVMSCAGATQSDNHEERRS